MKRTQLPKCLVIKREEFETCGWRTMNVAHGIVLWPDGRKCRYSVNLTANPGEEGDISLSVEDIAIATTRTKVMKLRRSK